MGGLDGRTAVITGGSSGIGLAIGHRFASEGALVYLTARRQAQLDEAVESIGPNARGVQADVSNLADLQRLYDVVAADGHHLDVVVANAGGGTFASLAESTEAHFDDLFATNVRGTYFTVQKALPLLNDGASVILLSSIGADKGIPSFGAYSASKSCIKSFARTWAAELAPRGIRVNTISPGAVKTPAMGAGLGPAEVEQLFDDIGRTIPLGRMAEPREIADAALFLATAQSSFITASDLTVDGGHSVVSQLERN